MEFSRSGAVAKIAGLHDSGPAAAREALIVSFFLNSLTMFD